MISEMNRQRDRLSVEPPLLSPARGLAVSPPLVPLSSRGSEPAFDLVRTRLGPMRDFVERADHRREVVETPELFSNLE